MQSAITHDDALKSAQSLLADLAAQPGVLLVMLLNHDGQVLAHQGNTHALDLDSFGALAAGSMAAFAQMMERLKENKTVSLVHEGESGKVLLQNMEHALLLLAVSTEQSVGWARFQVRKREHELVSALVHLQNSSSSFKEWMGDVSDADLDSLLDLKHGVS